MLKKILYISFLTICFFSLMPNVLAFGTSLSGKTNILTDEEFTVTFSVTNATNLLGLRAKLNYDSNKLSLVSVSGLNGYVVTVGTHIVADQATGKSGSFSLATLKFRAKSTFAIGENTTISLSSVTGSDGSDINGTGSSRTINMVAPKSTNNNLNTLTINGKKISGFSASRTSYNVTVDNSISSITIGASAVDSKASISGTGKKDLKIYQNNFNIIVTAENGSRKTYNINVIRKDSHGRIAPADTNNSLKNIFIENLEFDFASDVYNYDLKVSNEFMSLEMVAIAQSSKASVNIEAPDNLSIGLNKLIITVTAEDNSQQLYTINITRKDNVPTLTVEEIFDLIDLIESEIINIDFFDESFSLDHELYSLFIANKKDLVITHHSNNFLLYKWRFKGDVKESNALISTKINFESDHINSINQLTNFAHKILLNFEHNGDFPPDTNVTIFVGNDYEDDDLVNLYYYNLKNNKIELVHQNLKVENGFVEFKIEHASEYFLTKANLITPTFSTLKTYLINVIYIVIIIVQALFIFKFIKEKKVVIK